MDNPIAEFNAYRSKINEALLAEASTTIKRIFNLDQVPIQKEVWTRGLKNSWGL